MKKIGIGILVVLILILAPMLLDYGFRFKAGDPVGTRKHYWERTLAAEIPIGSDKKTILAWANKHDIQLDDIPPNRLYSNVERIPDPGFIKFPCSEWNIILTIYIDPNQKSTNQTVGTVGSCL